MPESHSDIVAEISKPPAASGWRLKLLAVALAILGMLIAAAAVTTGQDVRRERALIQLKYDHVYWENALAQAKLSGANPDKIAELQASLNKADSRQLSSYARYGRQFTSWDGYRYEEIVEQGYIYHEPDASASQKSDSLIDVGGGTERRAKNVVWYPLYPLLGWLVSHALPITANHALTAISWLCCLLASVVFFGFARNYFARFFLSTQHGLASETTSTVKPQNLAAFWALAVLLFSPCGVFLFANFTESLFILQLVSFLYCMQARWWWRAALIAATASACRSQGVLFGPILALSFLYHDNRAIVRRFSMAVLFGLISGIGIACYMAFLQIQFHDALAFMHAQTYWNVGLGLPQILYAANPLHAFEHFGLYAFSPGPIDWPRLWEALCLLWPPVLLLIFGWRYLSFELLLLGWILWGLPYVSNSLAGNPPMDTQWMSMGRFMVAMIPLPIILGATFAKRPLIAIPFIILWASAFAIFACKFGQGVWVG